MAAMREGRNGGKLKTGGSNGGGRPKNLPELDALIAEVLAEEKEDGTTAALAILKKWRQMATQGNLKAGEMLFDRGYGKPKQGIEHSGPNGGAIEIGLSAPAQADIKNLLDKINGASEPA